MIETDLSMSLTFYYLPSVTIEMLAKTKIDSTCSWIFMGGLHHVTMAEFARLISDSIWNVKHSNKGVTKCAE